MPANVFDRPTSDVFGHEQVAFCHDAASGLRAIVAIHNTALGPALGGTRFARTVASSSRSAGGM